MTITISSGTSAGGLTASSGDPLVVLSGGTIYDSRILSGASATLSSGDPVLGNPGGTEGLGTLQQGYLENSNVDVVGAFVQMVLAQRAYESNSKVIRAADDMYSQVNNMAR